MGHARSRPPSRSSFPAVQASTAERPSGQHLARAGHGRPLPDAVRTKMERALGHDFSRVRIHEGAHAESLGAIAYTRGTDLHFAPGRYSPQTPAGQELIGHELAHVVQQHAGRVAVPQGKGAPINADPALEAEADRLGRAAVRSRDEAAAATPEPLQAVIRPAAGGNQPVQRLDWKKWGKRAGLGLLAAGGAVAGGLGAAALGLTAFPIALAVGGGALAAGGLGYAGYRAYRHFTRPSAEARLARWRERGQTRNERQRIPTGRYQTSTGSVTLSGLFRQRMTQARQQDYGGESLGRMPPYPTVRADMPEEGISAIYDPDYQPSPTLTPRQRLATSVATSLSNASEPDRIPGWDKLVRGLARRRASDPTSPHPLDPSVNPAVSTAQEARDLMSGTTPLNPDQRAAIDEDASASSDEEAEHGGFRKRLLRK